MHLAADRIRRPRPAPAAKRHPMLTYHHVMPAAESNLAAVLADRLALARAETEANARRLAAALRGSAAIQEAGKSSRDARLPQHDQAYGRLEARLTTVPVIEQAKGVLMARNGFPADQATDMLRAMAQDAGVPLAEMAAEIVA